MSIEGSREARMERAANGGNASNVGKYTINEQNSNYAQATNTINNSEIETYDVEENLDFKYAFDLTIGNKIGKNSGLEYGFYSSDRAAVENEKLKLDNRYITEDSIIYRVVLVDDDNRVIERFTDSDLKIEELLKKYDADRLIADVRDENGNPQAWIKATTLLEGVEKIPVPKIEPKEEEPILEPEPESLPVTEEPIPVTPEEPSVLDKAAGTTFNGIVSAVEGIGLAGEAIIDTGAMIFGKLEELTNRFFMWGAGFDKEQRDAWAEENNKSTKAFIEKRVVADWFDEAYYYDGSYINRNSVAATGVRKGGNIVGELIPLIIATVYTGGAVGPEAASAVAATGASAGEIAVASGTATGLAVGAETYVAKLGKHAETNFNNGMSYEEGASAANKQALKEGAVAGLAAGAVQGINAYSMYNVPPNSSTELAVVDDGPLPPSTGESVAPTSEEVPMLEDFATRTAAGATKEAQFIAEVTNGKLPIEYETVTQFEQEASEGLKVLEGALEREEITKDVLRKYITDIMDIIELKGKGTSTIEPVMSKSEYRYLLKLFHPDNIAALN